MANIKGRGGDRGGSLLSFGAPDTPAKQPQSLFAVEPAKPSLIEDAVSVHQRAAARRKARSGAIMDALASSPEVGPKPAFAVQTKPAAETTSTGIFSRFRKATPTSKKPAPKPASAPVERTEPTRAPSSIETDDDYDKLDGVITRLNTMLDRRETSSSAVEASNSEAATATVSAPRATAPTALTASRDENWQPLIDPLRVVHGVADAKYLILALTLLGGLGGGLFALATPKSYTATAEILIDPRDLKITDRNLTDVNGLPSDSTIAIVENQVRVLTSSTVMNRVAEKLKLDSDPEFNGVGAGFDPNPVNYLRALLSRSDDSKDPGRLRGEVVSNLWERISVERTGKTFVVLVNVSTVDPEKSALIANTITKEFMVTSGRMQTDTVTRANDELNGQLEQLGKEVELAEQKVEKFKAENDLVDAQGRLITDDEIVKLNDQLSVARARTLELNARADSTRNLTADAVVGSALPEAASSGVITELRAQYAAAKQEADRQAVRLGPRHPSLQSANAQVAAVRQQIANELVRIAAQVQTELRRSVQLEQELASRMAQLKVRHGDVSNELVALRELERDANAKRSVYENFLLRARETAEQKGINSANVSIISEAYVPIKPNGPSRAMIALTGALLGLLSGIAAGGLMGIIGSLRESAKGGSTSRNRFTVTATQSAQAAKPKAEARKAAPAEAAPIHNAQQNSAGEDDMYYNRPGFAPHPAQQPYPAQPAHPAQAPYPYPQPAPQTAYGGNASGFAPPPYPPAYPAPAPDYHAYAPQHWPAAPAPYPAMPQPPVGYPQQPQPVYTQPAAYPHMPYAAPQPQPAYAPPQPAYAPQPAAPSPDMQSGALASISDTVREFRDAVRELTESRVRRRYF